MLEVEGKFAVDDFEGVRAALATLGAVGPTIRHDADEYLAAPDRDFRVTDEALRVRRVGDTGCVTYKGPKRDAVLKTREEIEVPLADGGPTADDMVRIFVKLGYRPVTVVRKERHVYEFARGGFDVQVTLDTLAEVGRFVEVEIVADESREADARETLLAVAGALGLSRVERRSYLHLLLAARGEQ